MSNVQFSMSESIKSFAPAFVKAQAAMGSAVKGKDNPFFKSKYADLAEVIEVCKDALNENGIAFLQPVVDAESQPLWHLPTEIVSILGNTYADMSEDVKADALAVVFGSRPRPKIAVCTILLHSSGEWMSCLASFPAMKEGPQDYFATTTYLRRACLQAILGIPAEDDDGNRAAGNKPKIATQPRAIPQPPAKVKPAQAPMPDSKARSIGAQATLPASVQKVIDERPGDDDQGPPQEAYFEAGQDCVGLVIKVEHKESRDGSKKWAVLTLACVNGDFQVKAWSRFDFASLDEVLDKQVWFKVFAKEFRGAMEYTIDMLELYNKKEGGA